MFFPERIINIKTTDKVLEIGPGADPYFRSDVLLEMRFEKEEEYQRQFGHTGSLQSNKPLVFYDGKKFPFSDKEFDYVICSHVLEHVPDVMGFLEEVFRVAGKGYFEYPLIYYEYLYNFDVHVNYLKFDGKNLNYMRKQDTPLDFFRPVQQFFYQSLQKGHVKLINDLLPLFMEGFEWEGRFSCTQVHQLEQVCHPAASIAPPDVPQAPGRLQLLKQLIRTIIK